MKATFIYSDYPILSSSHFRIMIPAKYLKRAGHEIETVHNWTFGTEHLCNTYLFEREIDLEKLAHLRSLGALRIVLTFDDAYHLLKPDMHAYKYWKGEGNALRAFRQALKRVEASVVPSRRLAADYEADYLPNYLDDESWVDVPRRNNAPRVVIGWGGTAQHRDTWKSPVFAEALRQISREYSAELVGIEMIGAVADDALFRSGVRFDSVAPFVPFENWPAQVASYDIGLAPLHGDYDMRRSNLKVLEYAAAGTPWIASNMGEYRQARGGILVDNNPRAWVEALRRLIEDAALRRELGEAGRKWAQTQMMSRHVSEYERILWPDA